MISEEICLYIDLIERKVLEELLSVKNLEDVQVLYTNQEIIANGLLRVLHTVHRFLEYKENSIYSLANNRKRSVFFLHRVRRDF